MRSIAHLFRHMRTRFDTNEAASNSSKTDHGGQRHTAPPHIILESRERVLRSASIAHDPQRHEYRKEPSDVQYHNNTFDERKFLGTENVKDQANRQHSPIDHSEVPCLWRVSRVPHNSQSLYLFSSKKRRKRCSSLPSQDPKPTNHITGKFLPTRRCEFAHPVLQKSDTYLLYARCTYILATRRRSPMNVNIAFSTIVC